MNEILPKALRPIMTDPKMGTVHYYPEKFKLDVVDGMKYIYTEAILPEIDDEVIIIDDEELNESIETTKEETNKTILDDIINDANKKKSIPFLLEIAKILNDFIFFYFLFYFFIIY